MSGWYWLLWAGLTVFNVGVLCASIAQTKRNLALLDRVRFALRMAQALMGEDADASP